MMDKIMANLSSKKLWVLSVWGIITVLDREIGVLLAPTVWAYLLAQGIADFNK